jgi:predicted HTH transcriptional regulator
MHPLELKDIIFEGESSKLEFKRKFTTSEKIAKEICAFANTRGGMILFGVEDNGKIYGVDSEKGEIDFIIHACHFYINPPIEPGIEIVNMFGKDVVVVEIEQSKTKPHFVVNDNSEDGINKAYIRVGEQSVAASSEMTKVLEGLNDNAKPLKLSIGDKEQRLFRFIETNSKATVRDFSKLVNISKRRAERLLVRLVRAGVLQIHQDSSSDYFTLSGPPVISIKKTSTK